jgi:hypothetical protein
MSEAILHAIDAPQISDVATAIELVERWRDSPDAPSTSISSFFDSLLQLWPEDGSGGAVWYEDFSNNKPAGPVLEMTFDLNEFNEERLAQLRAIAKQHGIHVLDSEGEVLYLADGSEAVA